MDTLCTSHYLGAVSTPALATRVVRGLLWTGSPFLVHILTLLLFYGSLPPEQMGPFAFALPVVMMAALLGDLGLGTALVQHREATDRHFSSAFWVSLTWGTVLTVAIVTTAPVVAPLAGSDGEITSVRILGWLSLIVPLASVSGLFRARLQRELRFAAMARAEIASVLIYSVVALALLPPLQLWALVIGSIVRELALLVGLWIAAAWRPRFQFSTAALRDIIRFGLNFTGERTVGFANSRLAQILILPAIGKVAAAQYGLITLYTITPLVRLSTILHRVSMPAFSTIQDRQAQLAGGYIKAIQGVALLLWPLATGMFLFAEELLAVVSQEYAVASRALQLLALAFILKSVGSIVGAVFLAKGRADWSFRWTLASFAILVPALILGFPHGLTGVAAAILATSVLNFIVTQIMVHRLIRFSLPAFLAGLGRPIAVCLALGLALGLAQTLFLQRMPDAAALSPLRELLSDRVDAATVLLQAAVCGLIAYAVALRLIAAEQCREYWHSLRGTGERGRPDAAPSAGIAEDA